LHLNLNSISELNHSALANIDLRGFDAECFDATATLCDREAQETQAMIPV